jgi:hypothetical protein
MTQRRCGLRAAGPRSRVAVWVVPTDETVTIA